MKKKHKILIFKLVLSYGVAFGTSILADVNKTATGVITLILMMIVLELFEIKGKMKGY